MGKGAQGRKEARAHQGSCTEGSYATISHPYYSARPCAPNQIDSVESPAKVEPRAPTIPQGPQLSIEQRIEHHRKELAPAKWARMSVAEKKKLVRSWDWGWAGGGQEAARGPATASSCRDKHYCLLVSRRKPSGQFIILHTSGY